MSAESSPRDRKREQDLEGAIRYMNDRLTETVSLSELAACLGVSRQQLVSSGSKCKKPASCSA